MFRNFHRAIGCSSTSIMQGLGRWSRGAALGLVAVMLAGASTERAQAQDTGLGHCTSRGWERIDLTVNGRERMVLAKHPRAAWALGAVLVLHGGGGSGAHFCMGGGRLIEAQSRFTDLASARGFAVFLLEATTDVVTDAAGRPCGKRFDFSVFPRANVDLPYVRAVIDDLVAKRRPFGSNPAVFMTGLSTGGYMTIRAAAEYADRIRAFAPVAAGDPFGSDPICDTALSPRTAAKGIVVDRETRRNITAIDACTGADDPNESAWPASAAPRPVFKQFHHAGDGIVDRSCFEKARRQLIRHGFRDAGAFLLAGRGERTLLNHLWQDEYNAPILDFFAAEAR